MDLLFLLEELEQSRTQFSELKFVFFVYLFDFFLPRIANLDIAMEKNGRSIVEFEGSQSKARVALFSVFENLQCVTSDFSLASTEILQECIRGRILRIIARNVFTITDLD